MGLLKKIFNEMEIAVFPIKTLEEIRDKLLEEQDCLEISITEQQKRNENIDPYTLSRPGKINGEISMLNKLINCSTPTRKFGLQTIDPDDPPNIKHYKYL